MGKALDCLSHQTIYHILSLCYVLVSMTNAENIGVNKSGMISLIFIELMILCGRKSINELTCIYIMNYPCQQRKEVLCVKYPIEFLAIIDQVYERFPFILPLYIEPPNERSMFLSTDNLFSDKLTGSEEMKMCLYFVY